MNRILKSIGVFLLIILIVLIFGILHNILSFQLFPDVFYKVFFDQFGTGNIDDPNPMISVLFIAIISSISMGLIFGFIYGILVYFLKITWKNIFKIIGIHLGITLVFSLLGILFGYLFLNAENLVWDYHHNRNFSENSVVAGMGMHNGTYLGSVIGLIIAFIFELRKHFKISITPK